MDEQQLKDPWLVAVWPGMGHVATTAGYYLMSKLSMYQVAELSTEGVFDVDYANVVNGLIQPTQSPRSRYFAWKAPIGKRDIVVFIGEAQPPANKYRFCQQVIEVAKELDVQRVFTFAAMASGMHPEHDSRVFAAATDEDSLTLIDRPEIKLLEQGQIGGLNGVLLCAAANAGMQGVCLLGEMPHLFTSVPFPKASLAVLQIFAEMADLELDFSELAAQSEMMEQQLGEVLAKVERSLQSEQPPEEASEFGPPLRDIESGLTEEDKRHIEELFELARDDRAKAYELKRELDRLEVFKDYEDRFLDLFKKH